MSHGNLTADAQAALARLNAARPERIKNYRGDYIKLGTHRLVIMELDRYGSDGTLKVKITGKYESSNNPDVKPGDIFIRVFDLTKPAPKPNMSTDADAFVEFLHKVTSTPFNVDMQAQRGDLLYGRFNDQLLRGMVVTCHGTHNQKKDYVRTAWDSIPQTAAEISARRAQLDQTDPLGATGPAAPPAQAMHQQQTGVFPPPNAANFGYPAMQAQFAPAPQQMLAQAQQVPPQGYPLTQGGPPPGWPPGYPWPPPAQGFAPQAPTQQFGAPLLGSVPGHQKP